MSEQSLLEELFPEASDYIQPHYTTRNPYPKLDLPSNMSLINRYPVDRKKTKRERYVENFQSNSENITALQLVNCSTELTEMDFRRLVPKGKHIDSWAAGGEFIRVIPGRDPLSLERLPFYFLVFRSPQSALAYQKNASRLHKLSQLHQPNSIMSALPPPKGFLEDGEDIGQVTASYTLQPTGMPLALHMVMQPYNPSLRTLLEQGGYKPVVPSISPTTKKPLFKVLMQIDGYEPLPADLYRLIRQHAYIRGITWPLHNAEKGISRLRDLVDLRAKFLPVASQNPRSTNLSKYNNTDPSSSFLAHADRGAGGADARQINQMIMNRVYNRWIVEFEEEEAAKRFARMWHRRPLPLTKSGTFLWKELDGVRMCNTEFLW
ncbi:hypothetical protein CC80DRAFT_450421 [Byssothecium circinans]|uniref:Uncharacterized protein n=1 Tax=Byssothecium circinans TaxID=147558 RepID=A0A6A5TLB1_9PLEO|nr:hypothetical protein CC80DRAFT_450421 [Byssothecium circinans]